MTAFWITPHYQVLPVFTSHIEMVIDHPGIFGMDLEEIRQIYARHQEPLRCEGEARAEIIRALVVRGFIRLRRYRNKMGEYWSVNARQANQTTMEILREFFLTLTERKFGCREDDQFIEIRLDTMSGRKDIVLKDLIEGYCCHDPRLTLWSPDKGEN